MITLLLLLFTKHLVFDFVYQPPYQWQNKGTYGHWGGLVHAAQHGVSSLIILLFFSSFAVAFAVAMAETIVHYHMDWFKMWYNKRKGWGANTHSQFWVLTGIDQYVHAITYIAMAAVICS